MAIVSCPECGKKLKIADTSVGKKVKGPCGHVFVANGDSAAPAASRPAPAVAPEKVYVACTECESKLKVATTSLGKKMKCPKCSAVFVADLPDEPPAKKAPPPPDPDLDEDEAPAPKAKGKAAKPAVTDDDMDDLLNFAQADAETKDDSDDDDDLFKNEPVKSRAKRRMDEDDEEAKPKGKARPKPDEDEEELPTPKKKPSRADEDEEAPKPVYPSRLIPNLLVGLLLLIFIGLVAAIFFDVNIAKELGLPESKGLKPKKLDLKPAPIDTEAIKKLDLVNLEGSWVVEKAEKDSKPLEQLKGDKYSFANGKVTGPDLNNADFTIDAGKTPKTIDLHTLKTEWFLGIYEFDGDLLKLCTNTSGEIKNGKLSPDNLARRPKAFDSKQGTLYFLKRAKGDNLGKEKNKIGKDKNDKAIDKGNEADKISAAKAQLNVLTQATQAYRLKFAEYPASLSTLLEKSDLGGPFVDGEKRLLDPWNHPYQYERDGTHNKNLRPDIWTVTPTKVIIGNWPDQTVKPGK